MSFRRRETGGCDLFLHDFGGYPFTVQLARALAARGHRTTYVYYQNLSGPKGGVESHERPGSLILRGVRTVRDFRKYQYLERVLQEWEYGTRVASRVVRTRPSVVVSANTPPIAQLCVTTAAKLVRARGVIWVQDVFGIAAESILAGKMGSLGGLAGAVVRKIDRLNLALSPSILTISESFEAALTDVGIREDKIAILPNWAPLDEIPYYREKPHLWGDQIGLDGRFCFMYTGALGDKHDPSFLLRLAEYCEKDDSARVVVVSEGPGADLLAREARMSGLDTLIVLPYQPWEAVPAMMAEADVLLASLTRDAASFSVPSKVLSYLGAGRAIVCLIDEKNDAARLVLEAGAGIVVDPADDDGFIEACDRLRCNDGERLAMGERARAFAERSFDIDTISGQFERLILSYVKENVLIP